MLGAVADITISDFEMRGVTPVAVIDAVISARESRRARPARP
jgi:hypothetical protein